MLLEPDNTPKANIDVSKLDLKYQFAFYDFCTSLDKCSREQAIELAKQVYHSHLMHKQVVGDLMKTDF